MAVTVIVTVSDAFGQTLEGVPLSVLDNTSNSCDGSKSSFTLNGTTDGSGNYTFNLSNMHWYDCSGNNVLTIKFAGNSSYYPATKSKTITSSSNNSTVSIGMTLQSIPVYSGGSGGGGTGTPTGGTNTYLAQLESDMSNGWNSFVSAVQSDLEIIGIIAALVAVIAILAYIFRAKTDIAGSIAGGMMP